jgi:hypothetical protein
VPDGHDIATATSTSVTKLSRPKPVGTLVHVMRCCPENGFGSLPPARVSRPSACREPQTYEDYDEIIITHTCREVGELTYGHDLIEGLWMNCSMRSSVTGLEENQNTTRPPPANTAQDGPGSPI